MQKIEKYLGATSRKPKHHLGNLFYLLKTDFQLQKGFSHDLKEAMILNS